MRERIGTVPQSGERGDLRLHVSKYVGPEGSSHLQLTSPFDIVQLDRAGVRDLYTILGKWLDGDLVEIPRPRKIK
jgi:hypothetical protein